jgi:hypothetical protein
MALSSKLYAGAKVVQMQAPGVLNSDTLSAKFDMQDYSELMLLASVGVAGDTWSSGNKIEIEVQDSPDDSTYTACADAVISNPVSGATNTGTMAKLTNSSTQASQIYSCAYRGNQRYVKVNINFTGTHSTGDPYEIIGLGWIGRAQPVNAG